MCIAAEHCIEHVPQLNEFQCEHGMEYGKEILHVLVSVVITCTKSKEDILKVEYIVKDTIFLCVRDIDLFGRLFSQCTIL